MTLRIPLAKPEITDEDREALMDVVRTPYLSTGPKVAEFEHAICDYTGDSRLLQKTPKPLTTEDSGQEKSQRNSKAPCWRTRNVSPIE